MKDENPLRPEPDEMDLARVHGPILREHQEPGEGRVGVPTWLVLLIAALVFWGGFYLATNSGGFRADGFNPVTATEPPPAPDPATLGQRTFVANCLICHQQSGRGVAGLYPPLAGSEWVQSRDGWRSDHLVAILLRGIEGPVQVNGKIYNGAMPNWSTLRDDEIAAVLTYIRSEWGNAASKITAEEVRAGRARVQDRAGAWTEADLRSLAPPDSTPGVGH